MTLHSYREILAEGNRVSRGYRPVLFLDTLSLES